MIGAAKRKSISPPGLTALWTILLLVVTLCLGQTRVWGFEITPQPASGVFAPANPLSIGENYDGWQYDASDSLLAAKGGAGAKELVSPGARAFMAGEKKLADLSADEVANAVKGYQQAADAAKSAAHRAYQEARIRALRGEADPPGKLLDFIKNFKEGGQ